MKKVFAILLSAVLLASAFAGCGNSNRTYKDGTYTGKSAVISGDEEGNGNGYGEVTITIKDNVITACEFKTYEEDGTLNIGARMLLYAREHIELHKRQKCSNW